MVEFQGKFDENTAKSVNNRMLKKFWWVFALISILFIFIGVIGILLREDDGDMILGVASILFGVLFFPMIFILSKSEQKKQNKTMSILSPETTETYQFYPDRLIIRQSKKKAGEDECEYEATTNSRYSYLYKVEETRDAYFLYISKMQSHVVNKRDLTQGSLEELNSILASNLGPKFYYKK